MLMSVLYKFQSYLMLTLSSQLVCRRAKFHFSDDVGGVDEMSVASDEQHHLDYFKQHFNDINARMKNTMYFV